MTTKDSPKLRHVGAIWRRMIAIVQPALFAQVLVSCAGTQGQSSAELVFVVESEVNVGRLEFGAERGVPFNISSVPAGTTIYRFALRPGEYCLASYTAGDLNVGRIYRVEPNWCVEASEGESRYAGHLRISANERLQVGRDEASYAQQSADTDIEQVQQTVGILGW